VCIILDIIVNAVSFFALADEFLSFAFERCYKQCWRNKRLILIYLIPVKMLLVSTLP
jgi:hypothetical protein